MTIGKGGQATPFLLPVALRLREYDVGPAGVSLATVMPDRYERMAVGLQGLLLGALAVVQEWDRDDNPGGEVGFINIGALKAGLREFRLLPAWGMRIRAAVHLEADEGEGTPGVGSGWGRDKGCEAP